MGRPAVAFSEHIPWFPSLFVCGSFSFCLAFLMLFIRDRSQDPDRLPPYYAADSGLELLILLLPLPKLSNPRCVPPHPAFECSSQAFLHASRRFTSELHLQLWSSQLLMRCFCSVYWDDNQISATPFPSCRILVAFKILSS